MLKCVCALGLLVHLAGVHPDLGKSWKQQEALELDSSPLQEYAEPKREPGVHPRAYVGFSSQEC